MMLTDVDKSVQAFSAEALLAGVRRAYSINLTPAQTVNYAIYATLQGKLEEFYEGRWSEDPWKGEMCDHLEAATQLIEWFRKLDSNEELWRCEHRKDFAQNKPLMKGLIKTRLGDLKQIKRMFEDYLAELKVDLVNGSDFVYKDVAAEDRINGREETSLEQMREIFDDEGNLNIWFA